MDVVSLAPVPVSALRWRVGEGPWSLAVVCKLTFLLRPERCALAKRQEPIHSNDLRTAELPSDRILAPCDRLPARPRVDVTAYVPGSKSPLGSEVRLAVSSIDRRVAGTGRIVHELAGLAGGSPMRPSLLPDLHDEVELPEGFDWFEFQCAPPEQRLGELQPDAELRLERVVDEHAVLSTRLPNVAPQTFLERDGQRREIAMRIDGLWFDGRRGLACVTFRAQIPLVHREEQGKVFIAVAGPDARFADAQVGELVAKLRGVPTPPSSQTATREDATRTTRKPEATETSLLGALRDDATSDSLAAFVDAAPPWLRRETASQPPPSTPTTARTPSVEPPPSGMADVTAAFVAIPAPSVPPLPPPSSPGLARTTPHGPATSASPITAPATLGATSLPLPPARPPLSTAAGLGPAPVAPPPMPSSPWSRAPRDLDASPPSVVAEPALPLEPARATEPRPPRVTADVIELLWFDAEATARLRRRHAALAEELDFAPLDSEHDLPSSDPAAARDHHTHFGLLTSISPLGLAELRDRVRGAVSETGRFTPPIVAVAGELAFPFEPLEQLKATAGAMTPMVGDDRRLGDAIAAAESLLASPLASASQEPIQKMLDTLRKAFREVRRAVATEQLDELVTRSLLEQRRYQRRNLLSGTWIRALLTTPTSRESTPCYLPESLASTLPMMTSFRARLLVEAHVRLDQYEASRHALRAVTLGRVLEL
ncbi:MAG: DUF2169 domain-containing protein [Deltaproteobacteria bacterium]|nr:DUF2169 domain-containing protein [Deltaproteobacteria bacterium]